ncbi:hypothetical protein ANO11243_062370 [Dothideomycetidae sp. 11243]|nr:hypothetical protein ANO11243_062370 [fungal sp. No.11243]
MAVQLSNTSAIPDVAEAAHDLTHKSAIPSIAEPRLEDGTPLPPPNGGYGWVCTACVFIVYANTLGINASYGNFLAHYLETQAHPGAKPLDYAFVGAISLSFCYLCSPAAAYSIRYLGLRTALLIGVCFQTLGLITASFATQTWQLYLSQGVCFAIGMGFLFTGTIGIIPQWFTTRRSLASGLAAAGSGFGGMVYSFAVGAMIRSLGLDWALRILGIVSCAMNAVCALLLRDRGAYITKDAPTVRQVIRRPAVYPLLGFACFSLLAYTVNMFSLAHYARFVGLSSPQSNLMAALFNAAQVVGRPSVGLFSDKMGRLNLAAALTFIAGFLALAMWISTDFLASLTAYSVLAGLVAGTFWATIAPITAEVVGLKMMPATLTLMWLSIVLPSTFAQPLATLIVHKTSNYIGAQIPTGCAYIAAAACLMLVRGKKVQYMKRGQDISADNIGGQPSRPQEPEIGLLRAMWVNARV